MKHKDQMILEQAYSKVVEAQTSFAKREQTEVLKSLLDTADWTSIFLRPEGQAAKVFINWLLDVAGYTEDMDERFRGQAPSKETQRKLQAVESLKNLINSR